MGKLLENIKKKLQASSVKPTYKKDTVERNVKSPTTFPKQKAPLK